MNDNITYIAHVKETAPGTWAVHRLDDHLRKVGNLAAEMAEGFGGAPWAKAAGLWHDLGKYRGEFQVYIKGETGYNPDAQEAHIEREGSGRVDHSTAGAVYATDQHRAAGRLLAYLIAGHHTGLPDWAGSDTGAAALQNRLENARKQCYLEEALSAQIPQEIRTMPADMLKSKPLGGSDGLHLWLRMLFSCLVDADFLDTERFMRPETADKRGGNRSMVDLKASFDAWMTKNMKKAPGETAPHVNRAREMVLKDCRAAGESEPGIYTLTVPTGGGKTLSGMAFALEHAVAHGKDRIIVAIPYTSIIEQTARTYKRTFGDDDVLEHHSNIEPSRADVEDSRSRLASENWDASIIVTTNVQLFESLFASRTSRCRKLHRIANSVIVLDEAQMLPPEFLQPILDTLRLLTEYYGATVVLSTATQPALSAIKRNFAAKEIISDVESLFSTLDRVRWDIPTDLNTPRSWEELAPEIAGHEQALVVVNRRQHARELHALLPAGTIHLSGQMCGAHRARVIDEIKRCLDAGKPVRVVSTQLVEAGVDIDFPVVYRAIAGLDSLAQAAGRCNREGKLDRGRVVVFVPPEPSPSGLLRYGEDASKNVLHKADVRQITCGLQKRYFKRFFSRTSADKHGVGELLTRDAAAGKVQFRTAAKKFRLIDDATLPVIVRYDSVESGKGGRVDRLIEALRNSGPHRWLMRELQPYVVQVYEHELNDLRKIGAVEEVYPGYWWIAETKPPLYSDVVGLLKADDVVNIQPPPL